MVRKLQQDLAKLGVLLALTRVNPELQPDLEHLDLIGAIGANRIFGSRKH
jgi:hypothetical protein